MDEPDKAFINWAKNLDREPVNVWREAMAQVRRLSDDVWNGLRFFLSFNGIIIAAFAALLRLQGINRRTIVALLLLVVLGVLITALARKVMTKQRTYYLEMLLKKSLLEKRMGFYNTTISGQDLSFVWAVSVEELDDIQTKNDAQRWLRSKVRGRNTITRFLFGLYDLLIGLYILAAILLIVALWLKSA